MGKNRNRNKRQRNNSFQTGLTPPEKIMNTNMAAPSVPNMNLSQVISQANESIYGTVSPQRSFIEPSTALIVPNPQNNISQQGFRTPYPPPSYPQPQTSTPVQDIQQPIMTQAPVNATINTQAHTDSNMALQVIMQNMNVLNSRLENVNTTNTIIQQKLQKLDMLDEIHRKLHTVEENINTMKREIKDIKALQDQHGRILANEERHHHNIEDRMRYLEEQNRALENENKILQEDFLRFQTHSMKYNLIFTGLPEGRDESSNDTENIVRGFITTELGIDHAERISFQNVHRLKPRRDGKPRSIIARFTKYSDHQLVLHEANEKLKNKNKVQYAVFQQFPLEINERRKALIPKLKEFQRAKRNAKLVYDKLIVDGQPYIPNPHGEPRIPGNN